MLIWIDHHSPLPPTSLAFGADSDTPGLLAAGGSLSAQRLDEAYRHGIFPWFSEGQPVLWWSPDPRMVLHTANFRMPRSLAKTLRRFVRTPGCEIRVDQSFERVIEGCAHAPRDGQGGTWIVPRMVRAYSRWHRLGRVHSFETWVEGELAGGLYGVAIGGMFFGESMFAQRPDASKFALAALVCFCRTRGIEVIDCQQNTTHLARFGAGEVARAVFEQHLSRVLGAPDIADWTYDESMWKQLDELHRSPPESQL